MNTECGDFLLSDLQNLKLIIDRDIGLVVKVSEVDIEAISALGGELVKFFQPKPELAWNKSSLTSFQSNGPGADGEELLLKMQFLLSPLD